MLESHHIHASFQTSIIMLEHRFKRKLLWSRLILNISKNALHYLANEAGRAVGVGTDKSRCGCLSLITFRLSCACAIALKIKNKILIRLDETHTHRKRLRFEYEGDMKDRMEDISLLPEYDLLQVFSIKITGCNCHLSLKSSLVHPRKVFGFPRLNASVKVITLLSI